MNLALLAALACGSPPPPARAPEPSGEAPVVAEVELVRPLGIAQRMGEPGGPMVVNFWATWCGPCREEQPRLHAWAQAHPEVRMVWVSLDLAKLRDRAVVPLLKEEGFLGGPVEHWQLDDPDPAMALGRLLPGWKGVVPTTLGIDAQGQVRKTWSRALDEDDLKDLEATLAP